MLGWIGQCEAISTAGNAFCFPDSTYGPAVALQDFSFTVQHSSCAGQALVTSVSSAVQLCTLETRTSVPACSNSTCSHCYFRSPAFLWQWDDTLRHSNAENIPSLLRKDRPSHQVSVRFLVVSLSSQISLHWSASTLSSLVISMTNVTDSTTWIEDTTMTCGTQSVHYVASARIRSVFRNATSRALIDCWISGVHGDARHVVNVTNCSFTRRLAYRFGLPMAWTQWRFKLVGHERRSSIVGVIHLTSLKNSPCRKLDVSVNGHTSWCLIVVLVLGRSLRCVNLTIEQRSRWHVF